MTHPRMTHVLRSRNRATGCVRVAACVTILLTLASSAPAQVDPFAPAAPAGGGAVDPFAPAGGAPPAAGDPFGPGAAPVTPPPAPAGGASASAGGEVDPTAQRVLDTNPQTVDQLMRAVRDLTNLGRPALVKSLIPKLNAANLTKPQMVDLHNRFGAGLFLEWSLDERYAPEAQAFGRKVLAAAREAAVDPTRIQGLLDDLVSDDAGLRRTAMIELQATGEPIVPPLIARLADDAKAAQHPRLIAATTRMGEFVEGPLTATLNSGAETLQANVAEILALRRTDQALPWLLATARDANASETLREAAVAGLQVMLGGVPSERESIEFLKRRAEEYRTGAKLGRGDPLGLIGYWSWDEAAKAVRQSMIPADDAAVLHEARVAAALYRIRPDSSDLLQLRLLSGLAAAKVLNGVDSPLPEGELRELAERAGSAALSETLHRALEQSRLRAAIAAAELLGEFGDPSVLYSVGRPSVLARALNAGQPRVRFAALKSIMQLDPTQPYWGSSVAMDQLIHFAGTEGAPRALIAHPRLAVAQTWAGLLMESGYEADVITDSSQLADQAVRSVDYELILISDKIPSPGLQETIQRIRERPEAQHLPIGILGDGEDLFQMQQQALGFYRTEAFPEPRSIPRMTSIVRRLEATRPLPPVTLDLRSEYGRQALQWLAKFADQPQRYSFYALKDAEHAAVKALHNPLVTAYAARVLAKLGTPLAQQSLVDLASTNTLPLEMRQAAATAFAEAVQRRGLMLIHDEVIRQYDRYNQSRFLPAETQQLLGSLLDVIEAALPRSPLAGPG